MLDTDSSDCFLRQDVAEPDGHGDVLTFTTLADSNQVSESGPSAKLTIEAKDQRTGKTVMILARGHASNNLPGGVAALLNLKTIVNYNISTDKCGESMMWLHENLLKTGSFANEPPNHVQFATIRHARGTVTLPTLQFRHKESPETKLKNINVKRLNPRGKDLDTNGTEPPEIKSSHGEKK